MTDRLWNPAVTRVGNRARLSVSMLLALVPFVFLVLLVRRCYVDVPVWDEWEVIWRLQRLREGTFTFVDLWGQHNEHRPLFGILAMMTLVRASQWNVAVEVAANVVGRSDDLRGVYRPDWRMVAAELAAATLAPADPLAPGVLAESIGELVVGLANHGLSERARGDCGIRTDGKSRRPMDAADWRDALWDSRDLHSCIRARLLGDRRRCMVAEPGSAEAVADSGMDDRRPF